MWHHQNWDLGISLGLFTDEISLPRAFLLYKQVDSSMTLWTCQIQEVEMTKRPLGRLQSLCRCCCSVAWSCMTLLPQGLQYSSLPVLHYLPELTQTHFHWVSGATQPPSPLLPSSPPAFNLFQQQGLFQWVNSSHEVPKGLSIYQIWASFSELKICKKSIPTFPVETCTFLSLNTDIGGWPWGRWILPHRGPKASNSIFYI